MTLYEMKEKSCCFTGHRDIPLLFRHTLEKRTEKAVRMLADKGVVYFIAGGALGFDTVAAQTILRLRSRELPHIKLLLALPCENQTGAWPQKDKQIYEEIRASADAVRVLSPHYYPGCMQARNRYMVDHAAYCICYKTKDEGGTAGTVRYAEKKGISVLNLADASRK